MESRAQGYLKANAFTTTLKAILISQSLVTNWKNPFELPECCPPNDEEEVVDHSQVNDAQPLEKREILFPYINFLKHISKF